MYQNNYRNGAGIVIAILLALLIASCGGGPTPKMAAGPSADQASGDLVSRAAPVGRTGLQPLGISNYVDDPGGGNNTRYDIPLMAQDYIRAGGRLEVTALPHLFNRDRPYVTLDRFVKLVLPSGRVNLTVTIYLGFRDWEAYPHNGFNWSLFAPRGGTESQRLAYLRQIGWLARLDMHDDFQQQVGAWASARGLRDQIHFVLVPMLEDDAPNAATFRNLLDVIARYRAGHGIQRAYYRRSALKNYFRVDNLPLEVHGGTLPGFLRSGDVWSNDGTEMAADAFIRQQRQALARGISCLWHRGEWNGCPPFNRPTDPPWVRLNLRPLTSTGLNPEALRVISSR